MKTTLRMATRTLVRCLVCGSSEVRTDEVNHRGVLLLAECPHCRHKWPLIKDTLDLHKGSMRHGMVSFPLTTIHPCAFRSASAAFVRSVIRASMTAHISSRGVGPGRLYSSRASRTQSSGSGRESSVITRTPVRSRPARRAVGIVPG